MEDKIEKKHNFNQKQSAKVHQNPRIYRTNNILDMYGFSKATLYRMIKAGTFPTPVSLTGRRAVGWTDASLQEWEKGLTETQGVKR